MRPIDILYDPKSSKAALRQALAEVLGVSLPDETPGTLFTACRNVFAAAYEAYTGLRYPFASREGKALQSIIEQLRAILTEKNDTAVIAGFQSLIENLPDWYRQNQFNLPVIDKKFNDIVLSIKNKSHGKRIQQVSDDYKRRVLSEILA